MTPPSSGAPVFGTGGRRMENLNFSVRRAYCCSATAEEVIMRVRNEDLITAPSV